MRLFEHADFEQAILRAAEHFKIHGLRPAKVGTSPTLFKSIAAANLLG